MNESRSDRLSYIFPLTVRVKYALGDRKFNYHSSITLAREIVQENNCIHSDAKHDEKD